MKADKWVWMPHPGHFIAGNECRFRLNTCVGKYIVSTVGELDWPEPVKRIKAQCAGVEIEGKGDEWDFNYQQKFGYDDLGIGRKYETMVFKAVKAEDGCCPWRMVSGSDVEMDGYNDAESARKGHMKLCRKWSKK